MDGFDAIMKMESPIREETRCALLNLLVDAGYEPMPEPSHVAGFLRSQEGRSFSYLILKFLPVREVVKAANDRCIDRNVYNKWVFPRLQLVTLASAKNVSPSDSLLKAIPQELWRKLKDLLVSEQ